MPSFNKCMFIGHLCRDVVMRYSQDGKPIAKTALAVNKKWKGGEKTLFLDVAIFGKTAEVAEKYAKKGDAVMLAGELAVDEWETKDGDKRKTPVLEVGFGGELVLLPKGGQGGEAKGRGRGGTATQDDYGSVPF